MYIAGFLDRLDGGQPQWDPGGVVLTRVDATHWTITLTGKEGTQIEYKYTLGDWEHVEKDGALRRDRQPAADAQLRRDGHAGRQRHRRQLEERRALRELINPAPSAADRTEPHQTAPQVPVPPRTIGPSARRGAV